MKHQFQKIIPLVFSLVCAFGVKAQTFTGELRKWHDIVLSVELPDSNLNESPETYLNHRMDVVFTDPAGKTIRVPGFFAADGDAANSSATSGKIYKAHLKPYATGAWKYKVLYYEGTDVAIAEVSDLPSPVKEIEGDVGNILRNNKALPDLRAKGRLEYQLSGNDDERRYLKFAETGDYFIKFGPDSPENFLDFNEFDRDASFNNCGNKCFEHEYNPHASDFNTGDPTWSGNRGTNIIGALNFLSENAQVNSLSMSLFGGDDVNVFPWTLVNQRTTFDVSKLAQWEIVFDHAERKGLFLHLKLAEEENWSRLSDNELQVYYREMVARFGHHLGIEWNIGEEFGSNRGNRDATATEANSRVALLDELDAWGNNIAIHSRPEDNNKLLYRNMIANNTLLTGASMQNQRGNRYVEVFDLTLDLINRSRNAGRPWVVASDEQASATTGIFTTTNPSNGTVDNNGRNGVLWNNLMAGGAGVMWYGGSLGDFQTEDFRRFNTPHAWCRNAIVDFFQGQGIQFWQMRNNDNLISGNAANHCLANIGEQYVIYLPVGGSTTLNLSGQTGDYTVRWFNPRNGGGLLEGSVTSITGGGNRNIGNPPSNPSQDWAILITADNGGTGSGSGTGTGGSTTCTEKVFIERGGVVAVEAEDFVSQTLTNNREWFIIDGSTTNTPKPDPDDSSNHAATASGGKLIELLPDTRVRHADPIGPESFQPRGGRAAIVNYKINFSTTGKYFVWVRAHSTGSEDNGIHVGIDGTWPGSGERMQWCAGKRRWTWESKQRTNANHCGEPERIFINVNTPGVHTVSFSMREDGFEMDKFVLNKVYEKPRNEGPAVEQQVCNGTGGTGGTPPGGGGGSTSCSDTTLEALADFTNRNITGFRRAVPDNRRNALSINAARYKGEFAAASVVFNGVDGVYNIKLNTLAELDGESKYRVSVNGTQLPGVFTNPLIHGTGLPDYTPASNEWSNVTLETGDEIRVEFSSETNGQIPEGTSTAFSRGRWTSIEVLCVDNNTLAIEDVQVEEQRSLFKAEIYPNPLRNASELNVNLALNKPSSVTIELFSLGGKQLLVKKYNSLESKDHNLKLKMPQASKNELMFLKISEEKGGSKIFKLIF